MAILFIILGILLEISGIFSIFNPISSALSTSIFMGVLIGSLFIINGINGLVFDCRGTDKSFWCILLDILMIIIGFSIIFSDTGILQVNTFLVICLGIATMFAGVSRIVFSLGIRRTGLPWVWTLISGILAVIGSILILSNPINGLLAFDYLLSVITIVLGFNMMIIGFHC